MSFGIERSPICKEIRVKIILRKEEKRILIVRSYSKNKGQKKSVKIKK